MYTLILIALLSIIGLYPPPRPVKIRIPIRDSRRPWERK